MHVMSKDVITIPSSPTSDRTLKVLMTHEMEHYETKRLIGIVTQSDLIAALYRAKLEVKRTIRKPQRIE